MSDYHLYQAYKQYPLAKSIAMDLDGYRLDTGLIPSLVIVSSSDLGSLDSSAFGDVEVRVRSAYEPIIQAGTYAIGQKAVTV